MSPFDADSRARLGKGLSALGIPYTEAQGERLLRYLEELERWNAAYNLTAIRDRRGMILRHLLDSAAILPPLSAALHAPGASLLDVGSGPGLPGLVLAILCPELPVTVLDSNGKKARFLRHAVRALALPKVTVAESRVEDWQAPQPYTLITSRAFSTLAAFFELTAPLLAPGGQWAAMKGKLADQERADCPASVHIREIVRLQVPGLQEDRHLVLAQAA
jgi:16S rRNA (guanine527-N7)-methyltransferase